MIYHVKNLNKHYRDYKYVVVRDCTNERASHPGYYYWGVYNDLMTAQRACDECGNGFVVESENVEALSFGEW